jgi:isoprene synthase
MPSFAQYVSNGWVTSTGPLLLLHALPAAAAIPRPPIITTAACTVDYYPRLVELSSTIFRLCNDCASHEAESERGDAPSSIACCMAEPWCAGGEEQARATVQGVIAETWKLLNREVCCSCAEHEESLTTMANLCLNLARVIHCIYQDGDGITTPTHRMKRMVKDLLFNPIL